MSLVVVPLPWTAPPLSMNDRGHWRTKARKIAEVRAVVALAAHGVGPMPAATLTLHYRPGDKRRRDTDNLFATVKAAADGLRDAGVIPDDDHAHLTHTEPVLHASTGRPGALWLEVVPRGVR